ncbi:MAG: hypothetical protein ACJARI_000663, partial [Bacteroidia bacterium]
ATGAILGGIILAWGLKHFAVTEQEVALAQQ